MQMSKEMLSSINYSENRFLIDWFSFSSRIDSFETMAELLGMSSCNWQIMRGVQGYSCRYYFEGISIHWAGNNSFRFSGTENEQEVKGAWLEMSGSGCRAFETYGHGDWQRLLDYVVFNAENITSNRLDIAYDDFIGLLDMQKIVNDTFSFNFVSKFRSAPEVISSIRSVNEIAYTVSHGRMKSDTYIRIYDKRLEQNAQEFTDHWIRNEIMLRHDRAFAAMALLCDEYQYKHGKKVIINEKKPINEVYFLIMNNYLRYIEPSETDSNKWRAPMAEHWKRFSQSVTTYRVSLWSKEGVDYNQGKLNNFVEHMAGAAIFTYISIYGVDRLVEQCTKKSLLLAPKYKLLLSELEEPVDNPLIDVPEPDLSSTLVPFTCFCCHRELPFYDFVFDTVDRVNFVGLCLGCSAGNNNE